MYKYYIVILFFMFISLPAMELVAHRGSHHYPENSNIGVKYALLEGYDGVEIDIQPLEYSQKPVFALSHDFVINREIDTKLSRNTLSFSSEKWQSLLKKDRHGNLTSYKASTLSQVLQNFKKYASQKQFLNIEIKSPMVNVFDLLTVLQKAKINLSQIQISSLYLNKLEEIRKYSSNVYLGYILQPNNSSLNQTAKKSVDKYIKSSKLNAFFKRKIDAVQTHAESNKKPTLIEISILQSKLKSHFGVHMDYLDLQKHSHYIKKLNDLSIPIYIYSLDKNIQPSSVDIYLKEKNLHIRGMITDTN